MKKAQESALFDVQMLLRELAFEFKIKEQLINDAIILAQNNISLLKNIQIKTIVAALIIVVGQNSADMIPQSIILEKLSVSRTSVLRTIKKIEIFHFK